nr:MAG TPA: hypothetical protein [Caudoviricetes sp.]
METKITIYIFNPQGYSLIRKNVPTSKQSFC